MFIFLKILLTIIYIGSIITVQIIVIRVSMRISIFGGLIVKKYEALDLEIISVNADVVLSSFGESADSPFLPYTPTSNGLVDLGIMDD